MLLRLSLLLSPRVGNMCFCGPQSVQRYRSLLFGWLMLHHVVHSANKVPKLPHPFVFTLPFPPLWQVCVLPQPGSNQNIPGASDTDQTL